MLDKDDTLGRQVAPEAPKKRVRIDMRNKVQKPKHSHHIARIAANEKDPENAANEATLIADGIVTFEWLAEDCTRCLLGQEWVDFGRARGWTGGHRRAIAELVRAEFRKRCDETAEQARDRLVIHTQNLHREARLSGDYGPAVSALRLQGDWLLPQEIEKPAQLHVHMDLSERPESELVEIVKRARLKHTQPT